jgi:hypothetical protein
MTTGVDETAGRQPARSRSRTQTICLLAAGAVVAAFLGSIARFYHPGTGFTSLIGFPAGHEYEAPQMRDIPHFDYPAWASYDGQYYAQRAFDPFIRDPLVDRAMDLAPFRARRILFSWTACVAGLGRPSWILEAYARQNVAAWLVLAWLLARWLPPRTPRGLALWGACLLSHGLLWSVRFALLDGPSLVLTVLAVRLVEDGHPLWSAATVGLNGLGRETNVLAGLAQPLPRSGRDWGRLLVAATLVILPLLLWEDYLRSIYRSTIFAGADQLTIPGSGLAITAGRVVHALRSATATSGDALQLCILLALVVQALFLVVHVRLRDTWWRIGAAYVGLMLVLNVVLWAPTTGAVTRVLLPMTVAFNVLLARETRSGRFWPWFLAGNLHLIPGSLVMPYL